MEKKYIIAIVVVVILIIVLGIGYWLLKKPAGSAAYNPPAQTQAQAPAEVTPAAAPATEQPVTPISSSNIQGMKVDILKEGSGPAAKTGDMVTVNYTGTLADGTVFDSSLNPGRTPFQFTLGQNSVIQGWELGVLGMKVGEERKLTIPPELAYGSTGAGGVIPPNATLMFDITMLKIN